MVAVVVEEEELVAVVMAAAGYAHAHHGHLLGRFLFIYKSIHSPVMGSSFHIMSKLWARRKMQGPMGQIGPIWILFPKKVMKGRRMMLNTSVRFT